MNHPLRILLIDALGSWLAHSPTLRDLEQVVLPIGLMSIASNLKHRFNDRVTVSILHRLVDCDNADDLASKIRQIHPDLIGIRGLHIYRHEFHEAARIARAEGVRIVIGGGPYSTSSPCEALSDRNLDCVVIGEGEITFCEIVRCILEGTEFHHLEGIAAIDPVTDRYVQNPPRPFIEDLDSLQDPDYSLIDPDRYSRFLTYGYNRRRQAVILSSRGCPFECAYCHNIFGRRFRMRSAERVVEEIARLHDHQGIEDFYFIDDNFNMDIPRVNRFCEAMRRRDLKVRLYFANGVRGDRLTPDLIDALIDAGTVAMTFAVETATPRIQTLIRKFNRLDVLERNIHHACDRAIMVSVCFMIGFPSETVEEAQATIDFVARFDRIVLPMFFSVKYYPDTDIYEMAKAHGFDVVRADQAYDEAYHDISHSGTPTIPNRAFQAIYFRFLKEVFLNRRRIENALAIQRRYFTEAELLDAYSLFFRRRIRDIDSDILRLAR